MSNSFIVHTIGSAPAASRALLKQAQSAYGMVPNFHAVMAEAPAALEAYMKLNELVSQSSLTSAEQHVAWMTINAENKCHYCTPAHNTLASMDNIDKSIITDIQNKQTIEDDRLEALRQFTSLAVQQRGLIDEDSLADFYRAGYTKQNALDVILIIAQKTLSNYCNHITHVPVDEAFREQS